MAEASQLQRVEWMWKSSSNPCSHSELPKWSSYSDVETAIIEEAYKKKLLEALLDDYHISFKHLIQISNVNEKDQRPVKRVINKREESRLREGRFTLDPFLPSEPFTLLRGGKIFFDKVREHFNLPDGDPLDDPVIRKMMVERAAKGLIVEGKNVGKQKEGRWLAQQLLSVKEGTKDEIWECCGRLYCAESFLYKNLNEVMRLVYDERHRTMWQSKASTFGPFAFLFYELRGSFPWEVMTVYRGANLSMDLIQQFQQLCNSTASSDTYNASLRLFPAFTSTSRNRAKAEQFGNVLFIIETCSWHGRDVAPYSAYDEEEQLLYPYYTFRVRSCTFDDIKSKWEISLGG